MHRINRTRRNPAGAWKAAAVLTVLLLIGLGLAACGGSGSSTTAATNASANAARTSQSGTTTPTVTSGPTGSAPRGSAPGGSGPTGSGPSGSGPSGPTGPRFERFGALRECLQKNGVTLPRPTPGQRPRHGFFGGPTGLPNGVTHGQIEAALKKCGGLFGGGLRRFDNPAYKQALVKFATCMRENGVNVPEPNTSGNGPVFNTTGLEPTSAKFRAAEGKCRGALRGALRAHAGGAGGGPAG